MFKPVTIALNVEPIPRIPVNDPIFTVEPTTGVKVLSGIDDSYNWPVNVTVDPTRARDNVVVKYKAIS